jgi:hypothetical protein
MARRSNTQDKTTTEVQVPEEDSGAEKASASTQATKEIIEAGGNQPVAEYEKEYPQFPTLDDNPGVEIAKRSPDRIAESDDRFRKVYVLMRRDYVGVGDEGREQIHVRNKLDVLQTAINNGVHPRGEASFDGKEDHPDGASVILAYSVDVIPSIVDDKARETTVPYHLVKDKYEGSTSNATGSE